ncbi:MAG TPA: indole-3-glycerol phosphate synthase TrpC, partial [Geminicoccaceae bacterium]
TYLDRIVAAHRAAAEQDVRPLDDLLSAASSLPATRGFASALRAGATLRVIAEIKRRSPSKGELNLDLDPAGVAGQYESGGAACLSVLTDEAHFQGRDEDLEAARAAVPLPVLRKDFTLDAYQVIEGRLLGADCILLILAALDDGTAASLAGLAKDLGMDVLLEVHDRPELGRALPIDAPLIGINNRNLKTLEVDLGTFETLAPEVPPDRLLVAESGLHAHADLQRMAAAGAQAFLVGESLMRQADVARATRALLGRIGAAA